MMTMTTALLLAESATHPIPRSTVLANPNCTGSIGQATAEALAYKEADVLGFVDATVTISELLTADEAEWSKPIALAYPIACVWYVHMDGSGDDVFSGTPTPGVYVEMQVAFESVTGELNAVGWMQEAIVLTTATITPTYTPTSGPSRTPSSTPTPAGTPTP